MTASQQPSLFDQFTQLDVKLMFFKESGLIFWRMMASKYGEEADWSKDYSAERKQRLNDRAAARLHDLGGLGSAW